MLGIFLVGAMQEEKMCGKHGKNDTMHLFRFDKRRNIEEVSMIRLGFSILFCNM